MWKGKHLSQKRISVSIMPVVETETRFQETRFRFHNVIYGAATYFLRVFRHQHNHKLLSSLPKSAPP